MVFDDTTELLNQARGLPALDFLIMTGKIVLWLQPLVVKYYVIYSQWTLTDNALTL